MLMTLWPLLNIKFYLLNCRACDGIRWFKCQNKYENMDSGEKQTVHVHVWVNHLQVIEIENNLTLVRIDDIWIYNC